MKIHELKISALKDERRVGRGIGSGRGKTAGRGTKGQNARTGGGVRIGFAGGQNPLAKLLPKKRGFKSRNPKIYQPVNVGRLEQFDDGTTIDIELLAKIGMISKIDEPVKLLATGNLTKKLIVNVQAVSGQAKEIVEKAGGELNIISLAKKSSKKPSRNNIETK